MSRAYDIGQVLYVIDHETQRVVPLLVCEEIRRKTTQGEEVSYLVRSGPDGATHPLQAIAGQVYTSVDAALDVLRKNFEGFLQQQLAWTVEAQRSWYQPQPAAKTALAPLVRVVPPAEAAPPPKIDVPSYDELADELAKRPTGTSK